MFESHPACKRLHVMNQQLIVSSFKNQQLK